MPIVKEQDFPRGGGGAWTTKTDETGVHEPKRKRRSQQTIIDSIGRSASRNKDDLIAGDEDEAGRDSDDDLLDTAGDGLFKVVKRKPTKKLRDRAKAAAEAAAKEKEGEDEGEFVVEPLTYDAIQVGLLSLGVVHEIREHEVVISLPGRTVGSIPLTAVSTPYTNLLKKVEQGAEEISALAPLSTLFVLNQVLIVRVTQIKEALSSSGSIRRTIILSSNPTDLHSNYNATLIEEGMQLTSAVQSIEDHGLVMDLGVKGVRAFLPKNRLQARVYAEAAVGQLIQCKVVLAKVQRLLCNVTLQAIPSGGRASPNLVEDESLNSALLLPGMVLEGHVMQTHKTGLKLYFLELMGTVHQDHTGKPWQLPLEVEKYSQVQATVLYIHPTVGALPALSVRRDLCPGRVRTAATLQRGVSHTATVERFEKRGLIVKFENGAKGIVSTMRCFAVQERRKGQDTNPKSISGAFPAGSKHRCRLLEYSGLDDLYVGSFAAADAPEQGEQQIRAGAVVKCELVEWKSEGALVRVKNGGSMGFITNLHFDKYDEAKTRKSHHPEGSILRARVLHAEPGKVTLTARKKLIQCQEEPIPEEVAQCEVGMVMHGIVFRAGPKGLHVAVVGGVVGFVPASQLEVPSAYIARRYPAGEIVRVRMKEVEPKRPTLIFTLEEEGGSIAEVPEEPQLTKPEETQQERKTKATKRQKKTEATKVEVKEQPQEVPLKLKRSVTELRPSTSFWDADEETSKQKEEPNTEPEPAPAKKSKKQRSIDREEEIRRQESALADPTRVPVSADDYELLLLASPHSSMAWIKYISMHLEAGNLAEARAVGERALASIPCTEERERFNLWTALLNLENEHGTPETLKARFQAALRNCDELATYKQMATIYSTGKKNEEARNIFRVMTKRFPAHVPIWSMAAQHLYKTGQFEEGRGLYDRAVAALPPRNHVEIISKFAQLEMAFGDFEQGRALYEKLIGTYGQRVDIWLVYINQLIKQKDHVGARRLFERVISSGAVNPRKIQPVFKRWLDFERENGTLESVAGVEEACAAYYKERLGLSVLEEGDKQLAD